jgi:hypothetical protein
MRSKLAAMPCEPYLRIWTIVSCNETAMKSGAPFLLRLQPAFERFPVTSTALDDRSGAEYRYLHGVLTSSTALLR